MSITHHSVGQTPLKSLLSYLKSCYPMLDIKLVRCEVDYILCGCVEIIYSKHLSGYEVFLFYLGSTRLNLGKMSVENIVILLYILLSNKEPFINKEETN